VRSVLILDTDPFLLKFYKEHLGPYSKSFNLLLAGNVEEARRHLDRVTVSVLAADLGGPDRDNLPFAQQVLADFPDMAVIVTGDLSPEEFKALAEHERITAYLEKPFEIEELRQAIVGALNREITGGTLRDVSPGMFLQLIEMEEKTCTVRVDDQAKDERGVLFFDQGRLMDARVGGLRGEKAAYKIFSWDQVSLTIEKGCPVQEQKIQGDMQAILLEAMRLKDEGGQTEEPGEPAVSEPSVFGPDEDLTGESLFADPEPREEPGPETPAAAESGPPPEPGNDLEALRSRLEKKTGAVVSENDVYWDDSHDDKFGVWAQIGELFQGGALKSVYLDNGGREFFILVPGDRTARVEFKSRNARERYLNALNS